MPETVALVTLSWGAEVLAVHTVRAGERVRLGDGAGGLAAIPAELLDRADACAVLVGHDGVALLVLPTGAGARLHDSRGVERCTVGPGSVQLARGSIARMTLGASAATPESVVSVEVEVMACEPEGFAASPRLLGRASAYVVAAAVVHLLLLAVSPAFALDDEERERERLYEMQEALARSEERSELEGEDPVLPPRETPERRSGPARAAASPPPGAVRAPDSFDRAEIPLPSAPAVEPAATSKPARRSSGAFRSDGARPATTAELALVDRVVRQNAARFRACQVGEAATTAVAVQLVIDGGRATAVRDVGSTGADARVIECTLDAFSRLGFPMLPEEGPVGARYRLAFSATRSGTR